MSKTINMDEVWEDLKTGIDRIYQQQKMSRPRYMELYT